MESSPQQACYVKLSKLVMNGFFLIAPTRYMDVGLPGNGCHA